MKDTKKIRMAVAAKVVRKIAKRAETTFRVAKELVLCGLNTMAIFEAVTVPPLVALYVLVNIKEWFAKLIVISLLYLEYKVIVWLNTDDNGEK